MRAVSWYRKILRTSEQSWNEEVICNPDKLTVDWKVITCVYPEHVHCSGTTYYLDREEGSVIEIDGVIHLDPVDIPGVPRKIVKRAIKIVEPFIGRMIEPNLGKFYKAVKKMMAEKGCLYPETPNRG